MKLQIYVEQTVKYRRADSSPDISQMAEHGVSWENIEIRENMENINRMTLEKSPETSL